MSLGTIKNRHQKAVRSSPFAEALKSKRKNNSTTAKQKCTSTDSHSIQFRTGRSRPSISSTASKNLTNAGINGRNTRRLATSMGKFKLGDLLKCEWNYGPAYGGGSGTFVGKLIEIRLDKHKGRFFFTLKDKQGVILDQYTPMCKLRKVNGAK